MAAFASWLKAFFSSWFVSSANSIIDLCQAAFDGLVTIVIAIVALLPAGDPFPEIPSTPTGTTLGYVLQALNWVFPVGYLITVSAFIVAGYLAYVAFSLIGRWTHITT